MFQDFNSRAFAVAQAHAQPHGPIPAQEAAELIGRYPNLSEIELARLINLYRGLSALDAALMISDERLGAKLDRFMEDHRSRVRPPFRDYAGLLFYGILTIGAVAWAVVAAI